MSAGAVARLADLPPLGFGSRDPHRDAFAVADAILAAGFVADRDNPADAIALGYGRRDRYAATHAAARDLLARGVITPPASS